MRIPTVGRPHRTQDQLTMKTHIRTLAAAFILLGMATAPAVAQSKKELVDRIVLLQQPGVEAMARSMGEQPAAQLVMQARQIIQNVPADKRDAAVKNIDAELKKYGDDVVPLLRDRAVKIAPTINAPELDKNYNEVPGHQAFSGSDAEYSAVVVRKAGERNPCSGRAQADCA